MDEERFSHMLGERSAFLLDFVSSTGVHRYDDCLTFYSLPVVICCSIFRIFVVYVTVSQLFRQSCIQYPESLRIKKMQSMDFQPSPASDNIFQQLAARVLKALEQDGDLGVS